MKNEVENIDKSHGNGVLPCVNRYYFDTRVKEILIKEKII